jgi:hypothetical protein
LCHQSIRISLLTQQSDFLLIGLNFETQGTTSHQQKTGQGK